MAALSFDDLIPDRQRGGGPITFDDLVPQSRALTFDDLTPTSFDKRITDSWNRGLANLKATGYGLVAAGADAVGDKELGDWGLEGYKDATELARTYQSDVPSYKDIRTDTVGGFATDAGKYAVDAVFENLPMFLPSLVTGGVGVAIARKGAEKVVERVVAAKMAEGLSRELAEKAAAKAVLQRVGVGAAAGALPSTAGMETGSIYGDIVEETGKRGGAASAIAFGGGLAAGSLDVLPQVMALKKAFGPLADEFTGSLVKRLGVAGAKTFLAEAGTEGAQTLIEQASVKAAGGKRPYNWDEVIDATLKGGLPGGILGVGGQGVAEVRNALRPTGPPPPPPSAPPRPGDAESTAALNTLAAEGSSIVNAVTAGQPLPEKPLTIPPATASNLPAGEPVTAKVPPQASMATPATAPVLRKDGTPFPTEAAAATAARSRVDLKGKGLKPVPVAGGFGLAPLLATVKQFADGAQGTAKQDTSINDLQRMQVSPPSAGSAVLSEVSRGGEPGMAEETPPIGRGQEAGGRQVEGERGRGAGPDETPVLPDLQRYVRGEAPRGLQPTADRGVAVPSLPPQTAPQTEAAPQSGVTVPASPTVIPTPEPGAAVAATAPVVEPSPAVPPAPAAEVSSPAAGATPMPATAPPAALAPKPARGKRLPRFARIISKKTGGKGVAVFRADHAGIKFDPLIGAISVGNDVDESEALAAQVGKSVLGIKRKKIGDTTTVIMKMDDGTTEELNAADTIDDIKTDMRRAYSLLECVGS